MESQESVPSLGRPIRFSGFVDDFGSQTAAIQFSLDDGRHWTSYPVQDIIDGSGVSWTFAFTPTQAGVHCLRIRSLDSEGRAAPLMASIPFEVLDDSVRADILSHHPSAVDASQRTEALASDFYRGDGVRMRALGGSPLEQANVFRSDQLAKATEADARMIQSLGIRTIYDIRTHEEVLQTPDPLIAGVCTISLTPGERRRRKDASKRLVAGVIGEYGNPEERMRANYRRYVQEYPLLGQALRSMADLQTPCLIHCANGKDRTGVLCAVLQRIVGVRDEAIYEDYLAYNSLNADLIAQEAEELGRGMSAFERSILMSFLEVRESYLDAFFAEVEASFGTFDEYVSSHLRLDESHMKILQGLAQGGS